MLETSALAATRVLEVWRLLLRQWSRSAEPNAMQRARALQGVVAKRLAARSADLALMRAMCRMRRDELAAVRMRCRTIRDQQRMVRFQTNSEEPGRGANHGS
jgi:hypothetical protein